MIQAKKSKLFCTGCPKSALNGGRTNFLDLFFHGCISNKSWEEAGISWYGLLEPPTGKGCLTIFRTEKSIRVVQHGIWLIPLYTIYTNWKSLDDPYLKNFGCWYPYEIFSPIEWLVSSSKPIPFFYILAKYMLRTCNWKSI